MAKKALTKTAAEISELYRLGSAYWGSGVLFAALRLGIFDTLEARPLTSAEMAKHLKAQKPWTEKFLLACVGLGLVVEQQGVYANSDLATTCLVKGKPAYQGDLMMYLKDLWMRFHELDYLVTKGQVGPLESAALTAQSEAEKKASERVWVMAMHNIAMSGQAEALCAAVDLRACHRLLDVGGGSGTYSIWLAQKYPKLTAEVLDAPEIISIANEIVAQYGMTERVVTRAGDFLNDSYGHHNTAVLFSGVLHGFDEKGIQRLLKKAFQSLVPGGTFIVQEMLVQKSAQGGLVSPFPVLFGLNMMSGGAYTAEQITKWLNAAGLVDIHVKPLKGCFWFDHVIVGRKPS